MIRQKYIIGFFALILLGYLAFTQPSVPAAVSDTASSSIATSTITMQPATAGTSTEPVWYRVISVVDGDTIKVDIDGATTTVRLIGLDTPETVDPRKPVQCFGKEASAEMKTIVQGQYVRLESDPTQAAKDIYGRTLAYVYAPLNVDQTGLLVNEYMIKEGYGHEYTYNVPYKYQKQFKAAEAEARTGQKGLWAPGVCASS